MSVVAAGQMRVHPKRHFPSIIPKTMDGIVPGHLMVKLRGLDMKSDPLGRPTPVQQARLSGELGGAQFDGSTGHSGWTRWDLPAGADPRTYVKLLQRDPDVIYAEPEFYVYPVQLAVPNDGDWYAIETRSTYVLSFGSGSGGFSGSGSGSFGSGSTGSGSGSSGGGVGGTADFRRLWNIWDANAVTSDANSVVSGGWAIYPGKWYTAQTKPTNCPIIAFIDTGADMNHPDFINAGGNSTAVFQGGQLMQAASAYFENGLPVVGGSPMDQNGHGTHVTGIAIAAGNNGSFDSHGVIGIGYNSRGLILRVFDSAGNATDSNAAGAIYYAVDNGADIINLSLGDTNYSQVFQDAVTYAWQKGALVVCAGNENGNGGGNLGPIYPAACSGALGVTANGPGRYPADDYYAGYGYYVGIAAPGGDLVQHSLYSYSLQYVFSTATEYPCSLSQDSSNYPPYTLDYTYLVGTSMATPHVSGAAGLFYGQNSLHQADGYSNIKALQALQNSALGTNQATGGGWDPTQGYGSLDVNGLLSLSTAPNPRGATLGDVTGIVYYGGTPIPNVSVTATLVSNSQVKYSTTTYPDGTYRFDAFPAGVYNISAAPFGSRKTKEVPVSAGCDFPGVDFFCGPLEGYSDTTPPTVAKFSFVSSSSSQLVMDQWAYDTETEIDSATVQIGSTPGGHDVLSPTTVLPGSLKVSLTGLKLPTAYYATFTYTNGVGLVSTGVRTVNLDTQDATVIANYPKDVVGTTLMAENIGGQGVLPLQTLSYLTLDLSSLDPTLMDASLQLYGSSVGSPATIGVYGTTGSFTESGLNWADRPTLAPKATADVTVSKAGTYTWNIAPLVQAALQAGQKTLTIALKCDSTNGGATFVSSRGTVSEAPHLAADSHS